MTITIRKLEKTEHEYFAYCKSLCGKATYLLYFDDSILGAVVLHNFRLPDLGLAWIGGSHQIFT